MKKHIHADLIHAWAEGAEIQVQDNGRWVEIESPRWHTENVYRIKPREFEEGKTYPAIDTYGVRCVIYCYTTEPTCLFNRVGVMGILQDSRTETNFKWIGEAIEINWPLAIDSGIPNCPKSSGIF